MKRSENIRAMASRVGQTGFTLLEVLVATAILGTAVTALMGLLSESLGNAQRLRGPSRALMLGQSRMNELLAAGVDMGNGTAVPIPLNEKIQGNWDEQFRWEAFATRFSPIPQTGRGQAAVVRIVLDVYWKPAPGKEEKKLSLETYQLRQEPLEPVQ